TQSSMHHGPNGDRRVARTSHRDSALSQNTYYPTGSRARVVHHAGPLTHTPIVAGTTPTSPRQHQTAFRETASPGISPEHLARHRFPHHVPAFDHQSTSDQQPQRSKARLPHRFSAS